MTPVEDIETKGFTVISDLFSKDQIATALNKVRELEKVAPIVPDEYQPRLNKIAKNVYNLPATDKFFIDLFTNCSQLETILLYLLNDNYTNIPEHLPNYILRSLGARSTDSSRLPLHIDSFIPYMYGPTMSVQCILFLEDSTIHNGCTIVKKGSHEMEEIREAVFDPCSSNY